MKSFINPFFRLASAALSVAFLLAAAVQGQTTAVAVTSGKLQIDALDRLAQKAAETVNVNLDERLLRIVPPVLSDDPDGENVKKLIANLRGIYVRRFEFDAEGQYAEADVAPIRAQLSAPGWSRIVEVRSRRDGENIEVYLLTNGGRVDGLAILSVEPKELTVVNIVGTVDLDVLAKLEGQFGVPEFDLEKTEDKTPPKKH